MRYKADSTVCVARPLKPIQHRCSIWFNVSCRPVCPDAFARDDITVTIAIDVFQFEGVRLGECNTVLWFFVARPHDHHEVGEIL